MPEIDVLVRGAGPVGCALALGLADSGLKVQVLSAKEPKASFRPIALSYASRLILERLGVWRRIASTPIETVLVSQQQGFGRMRMEAAESGVPALGYVTEYADLHATLRSACEHLLIREEAQARLVVHAEGASPSAREKRYAQDALVALVRTEPASLHTAFERFTPEGPLALLPFKGRYAVVWSCRPERAAALRDAPEQRFLEELASAAGTRPGRACEVQARAVQPLMLRVQRTRVAQREVYIGNAAQTLHPVAGQGLNLGLRDAWELAAALSESSDPGDERTLARYASSRRIDAQATIRITDMLAGAFLGTNPLLRAARGGALAALDLLPGARRFFARRMMFGSSALP